MGAILVTGATSQLGLDVCRQASKLGYTVVGSVRPGGRSIPVSLPIETISLDLRDSNTFIKLPNSLDAVIHIGGATDGDPESLMQCIGLGTLRLIQSAANVGAKKFIFVSSMAVYGEIEEPVVDEFTPIRNPSPYGLAKLTAERHLRNNFGKIKSLSVRVPALVGPTTKGNSLAKITDAIRLGAPELKVSNPEFLFNNLIRTECLALSLVKLLHDDLNAFEAFPVASTNPMPFVDVVDMIRFRLGYRGRVVWNQLGTPFRINSSRAIALGLTLETTLEALDKWLLNFDVKPMN